MNAEHSQRAASLRTELAGGPASLGARAVPILRGREMAPLSEERKDSALLFVHLQVSRRTACEMSDSEDDGVPQLSSHALAALQEFYAEQEQHAGPGGDDKDSIGVIEENWVRGASTAIGKYHCGACSGPGPVAICPTDTQTCVTRHSGADSPLGSQRRKQPAGILRHVNATVPGSALGLLLTRPVRHIL